LDSKVPFFSQLSTEPYSTRLWTRHLAQTIDTLSSKKFAVSEATLMAAAGAAVAKKAMELKAAQRPVLVLCGPGNNGADGLVAARLLHTQQCQVTIACVIKDKKCSPAFLTHLRAAQELKINITEINMPAEASGLVKPDSLIIDAVLGIGFHGTLAAGTFFAGVLGAIRDEVDKHSFAGQMPAPTVLAVDLPSGLDADAGDTRSVLLPAHYTVTFGTESDGLKPALVIAPARDFCGQIDLVAVGFPVAAVQEALSEEASKDKSYSFRLAHSSPLLQVHLWNLLPASANKYDKGHVLVIGGSVGKTGAPLLSALAALRTGAGWASVSMPESATASFMGEAPREITFEKLYNGELLCAVKLTAFVKNRNVKAIVIGPGSMQSPLTAESVLALRQLAVAGVFIVVDAGGTHDLLALLNASKTKDQGLSRWICTPHPGEWRKLQTPALTEPLCFERLPEVFAAARNAGVTLMHKGATPIVIDGANAEANVAFVINAGDTSLAKAGSGDVLCGIIAAHGAIGYDPTFAALRSLALAAAAAKVAAACVGLHGVLPSDVIAALIN
jgi:NAD(P)H-hydrate epimerase